MNDAVSEQVVRVDVWSDVQCIWCYISSARLRTAAAQFAGRVEVKYRSYQLTPDAPFEIDRDAHIRAHNIDPARMRQIGAQLAQLTAAEGLGYEPDRTQPTNSSLALQLLHHAGALGKRPELTERLFTAYFAEGRHIGRIDELISIATEAGLDPEMTRSVLDDGRYAAEVDADIRLAQSLGTRGVPFYVINDAWALSGAQPVEQFLAAYEQSRRS